MAAGSSRGRRRVRHRQVLIAASAIAGGALAAQPTGLRAIDIAWCAAFAALLAYAGSATSRLLMLPVAGAAVMLADTRLSLGLALGAVACAAGNAVRVRFSNRWGAAAGGVLALALLTGSGPSDDPLLDAISTTALVVVVLVGAHLQVNRRRRRTHWITAGAAAAAVALLALAGGTAGLLARGSVDDGVEAFGDARDTGVAGDLQRAATSFRAAELSLRDAGGLLGGLGRLGWAVPGLSQQLRAADQAVAAAGDAAEAGRRAGRSIDLDDIAVEAGRVDLVALAATRPALDQLSGSLRAAVARLEAVDRAFLAGPLSEALDDALDDAVEASTTADRLARAVEVAPRLMGSDGPRRYLALFTTPVEARGRIGFPGGYAVLRFEGGRLSFESADTMDGLDDPRAIDPALVRVPPRAAGYAEYRATEAWRSVTLIPDAPTSADLVRQFAAVAPEIGAVDGVLYADPHALAGLVGLVGTIEVPGVGELTADTTFEYITRRQYLEFADDNAERKDVLGLIAGVVGLRLEGLSLPSVRSLTDTFGPLVEGGHLMLTVDPVADPQAAALLADARVDGAFPRQGDLDSNLVFVASRNSSGNKIDLFLERTLQYSTQVDEGGGVRADLTVELTNTSPAGGLPDYVIGSSVTPKPPLGWNLSSTFVYSRLALTEMTVDGQVVLPLVSYDGDLFVYQVQTDMAPGQTRLVRASFEGESYGPVEQVVVYPGNLAVPDEVSITIEDARTGSSMRDAFTSLRPECRAARKASDDCR